MTLVLPEFKAHVVTLQSTCKMNKIRKGKGKGRMTGNEERGNGGLVRKGDCCCSDSVWENMGGWFGASLELNKTSAPVAVRGRW